MSVQFTFTTSATLAGARDFNKIHRVVAQNDLGAKLEKAISAINDLQSSVCALNSIASAFTAGVLAGMSATAAGTSAAFSIFSGVGSFTSTGTTVTRTALLTVTNLSNFRA